MLAKKMGQKVSMPGFTYNYSWNKCEGNGYNVSG